MAMVLIVCVAIVGAAIVARLSVRAATEPLCFCGYTVLAALVTLALLHGLACLTGGAVPAHVVAIPLALVAAAAAWWGRDRSPAGAPPSRGAHVVVLVTLVVACFWPAFAVARLLDLVPHAPGDAMAIWNFKARTLADPEFCGSVFAPGLGIGHADYPLLLPAAVAALFVADGTIDPVWPACVGIAFGAAILLLIAGGLLRVATPFAAVVAVLGLAATTTLPLEIAAQLADVPVAAFVLGAVVAIARHATDGAPRALVLAGLCLGAAAATKNEGAIHAVVVTFAVAVGHGLRPAGRVVLGLAPAVLGLVVFHRFTPRNDLAERLSFDALVARGLDLERHATVLLGAIRRLEGFDVRGWAVPAIGAAAVLLTHRAGIVRHRASLLGMLGCLIAIHGVYVATPQDLTWHLETSQSRLLLQLFPASVFALLATARGRRPPP